MRHKNSGRKFDRNTSSRRAMLRNLTANLILHERIETTDAKAKELRRVAERLITKARRLGQVAYTPQKELSPADKARRLAAARNIAAYIPRFGVRVETGGATTQGRPRREGPARPGQALRDAPRRLHAHHQVRAPPGRRRPHLAHRARGRGAKEEEPEKKGRREGASGKSSKKATAAAPTEGAKVE